MLIPLIQAKDFNFVIDENAFVVAVEYLPEDDKSA